MNYGEAVLPVQCLVMCVCNFQLALVAGVPVVLPFQWPEFQWPVLASSSDLEGIFLFFVF